MINDIIIIRLKDGTFYEARDLKMFKSSFGKVVSFKNRINDNKTMINASLVKRIYPEPKKWKK